MRHERFKRCNLWKYRKTYFNLTCVTVILFVSRTISDTLLGFITCFSLGVNNQLVPIYQSSSLYLFLLLSLFLSLSLHAQFLNHYPRLSTTSHNFTSTTHKHPRPAIVSLPPPTSSNFTEKLTLSKLLWYGFRYTFFFISNSIFEVNVRVA